MTTEIVTDWGVALQTYRLEKRKLDVASMKYEMAEASQIASVRVLINTRSPTIWAIGHKLKILISEFEWGEERELLERLHKDLMCLAARH
jgi:hypothetical protein